MASACGYTWDTFCILFKAGSAPVPVAQSWILHYGPLHRMILKLWYLYEFEVMFKTSLGYESGDLVASASIYEKN
jgi:hypothetical protein